MKFKTGFMMGAAAGIWAANKAGQLQRFGVKSPSGKRPATSATSDQAAEKVRALSDLAKERLSDLIEGPFGDMARQRVADLIHSSLTGTSSPRSTSSTSSASASRSVNGETIDTTARWPR